MTDSPGPGAADLPRWWETLRPGDPVTLGIVKIDREGSTEEKRVLPEAVVAGRYDRYTAGVEAIARGWDAAPLRWNGDGVMLFIPDGTTPDGNVDPCEVRAFRAAVQLLEAVAWEQGLHVRIAVHAAQVAWNPDPGKLLRIEIDVCGHMEQAAPVNGILVHEDVVEALPPSLAGQVRWFGTILRDRTPTWVYPPALADAPTEEADPARPADSAIREALRRHVEGPNVRMLRYVGVRLRRLVDPPALDLLDVFVEPSVRRSSGDASGGMPEADEILRHARRRATDPAVASADPVAEDDSDAPESDGDAPWNLPFGSRQDSVAVPERLGAVLARCLNVILVGEPGSGKTTIARWVAVAATGGRARLRRTLGIDGRLVPVLVSVGALAEDWSRNQEDALSAIARCLSRWHVGEFPAVREWLAARLAAREVFLILDGLDEVGADSKIGVVAWLESFVAQHAGNRVLVTSRPAGFGGFALPGGFETHTIEPFEDAQVDRYVRRFTHAYRVWELSQPAPGVAPSADVAESSRVADDLLLRLRQNPRLAQLARNAFLLSIACLVHRAEGRLPGHRVGFYEIVAETLAETWEDARRLQAGTTGASVRYSDEARRILGRFAFAMHVSYPRGLAPRDEVLRLLAGALHDEQAIPIDSAADVAKDFLRLVGARLHLLVERAPGHWGFFHLTFQEFFAAVWLCMDDSLETEGLKHLLDPRWEEVLRLAVGYTAVIQGRAKAVSSFLEKVLAYRAGGRDAWRTDVIFRHHCLAALFLAEVGRSVRPEVARQVAGAFATRLFEEAVVPPDRYVRDAATDDTQAGVLAQVIAEAESPNADRRAAVVRLLGASKAVAAVPVISARLADTSAEVREQAASALASVLGRNAIAILIPLLADPSAYVRATVLRMLGSLRAIDEAGPMGRLLTDRSATVREAAVEAVNALDLAECRSAVDSMRDDASEGVRLAVARTTIAWLHADAEPSGDSAWDRLLRRVHGRIASQTDPDLVANLARVGRMWIEESGEEFRRMGIAILGVIRHREAVPQIVACLRARSAVTRTIAAAALGEMGVPEVVSHLLCALEDPDIGVRRQAGRSLWRVAETTVLTEDSPAPGGAEHPSG